MRIGTPISEASGARPHAANLTLIEPGQTLFTPFNPLSRNDLEAWYDVQHTTSLWQDTARTTPVVVNNDPVGSWDDLSGKGRHLQQVTPTKRPLLKIGVMGQPGSPYAGLQWDASDDYLTVSGFTIVNPTTIYIATRFGSTSARIIFDGSALATRNAIGYASGWFVTAGVQITGTTEAGTLPASGLTAQFNGLSASTLRRNGVQVASGLAGVESLGGITVGARYDGAANRWSGATGEVLVFSTAHDAATISQIENYLKMKWALVF